jgi:hypothetical protein
MQFLPLMEQKGLSITNEMNFAPKPSSFACKYCPYGIVSGSGKCKFDYGVKK